MILADRSFCITLPEMPHRRVAAEKHFAEVGLDGVEFFHGMHGPNMGLATQHTYEEDTPGGNYHIGPITIGIWVSHYLLWRCLQYVDGEHFLIMEDDAKFSPGWQDSTLQAFRDVPKGFDLLYLGSCCCDGHGEKHVKGRVFSITSSQCLHCYIVAKKALPFILQTQRRVHAPVDISLVLHTLPHLKTYAVLPRIADQHNTEMPP